MNLSLHEMDATSDWMRLNNNDNSGRKLLIYLFVDLIVDKNRVTKQLQQISFAHIFFI